MNLLACLKLACEILHLSGLLDLWIALLSFLSCTRLPDSLRSRGHWCLRQRSS